MQFFGLSRYVGPAPVPLAHYNAYVRACMAAKPYLNRDRLVDAALATWSSARACSTSSGRR